MFCTNCRTLNDDASNFCCKCGNVVHVPPQRTRELKLSKTTMLQSPHEQARQMIQVSAVLCYVIAALHLYELFVATDGAFRFGSAAGAGVCAVVAWKLWSSNSFAAGIVAFAILCLESFGLLAAVAAEFAKSSANHSGSTISGYIVMLAIGVFAAGCSTLRATIRMKRIAAQSAFP